MRITGTPERRGGVLVVPDGDGEPPELGAEEEDAHAIATTVSPSAIQK